MHWIWRNYMKDMRPYKFKNRYLNHFFWNNNVFFIKAKDINNKIICYPVKQNNETYILTIINEKITNIKEHEEVSKLVFLIIDNVKKPDYLYIDKRLDLNNTCNIYLSKKMNIKITKIDNKTKIDLIVYNYFKFKSLIKKQGYDKFYEQYKVCGINENIDQVIRQTRGSIDDYFYITTLKNIIRIYKKEVDNKIDYTNPSFKDKMIFKYLDNYFSKFAIIDYDKDKVKKFISDYYITEIQSEDQSRDFVNNLIFFYQQITNNTFVHKNSYKFSLKECSVFSAKKAKQIKYKHFEKYFDHVMEKEKNYNNLMFMLEILDLTEYPSDRKKIINYISIFELLLVKGNRDISLQLQKKCIKLLNNKGYSENEIKLAYDYRSKIIHGEHKEAIDKLHQLSLIDNYQFTKEELEYEIYLNYEQMLEKRLCERLHVALKLILKYFIFNNQYLNNIKKSVCF